MHGATLFQDSFEAGTLNGLWSVSGTSNGRVAISTDHGPATGTGHLVFDDAVSDAVYSVSEGTLTLDLTNKKNVVLGFKAKSIGNEAHPAPSGNFIGSRAYDGVAVSIDGGYTWRTVQSLDAVQGAWTAYNVVLDPIVTALGGTFGPNVRIRFSHYDNAPVPLDGIAVDDVVITADTDQRAVLELPTPLQEGTGPHVGYAMLSIAPTEPVTLTLVSTPSGQLSLPSTVTVPAGQTYATFEFSVQNDQVVNLTRTISVSATAPEITSAPATLVVNDDDVPVATLNLPVQLTEGGTPSNNAALSIDKVTTSPLVVSLTASPAGEVIVPSTVTIPAGQSQVVFTIRAVDDSRIDGSVVVSVTASSPALASVSASTTAADNETNALALGLATTVTEGGTAIGTVTISGTLPSALDVSLTSANEESATVPATVTIPAGQSYVMFNITGVENSLRDGSRTANITVAAAGFTSAAKSITVRDNEVAAYRFGSLGSIVTVSSALSVTVTALDIEGNAISGFSGAVNLSVVLPNGTTQALTPASVNLSGTGSSWTGNVTFPALSTAPLRLRATDAAGNTGESTPFDILRTLAQQAADLVWDAARGRIYASVPAAATGSNANKVLAIDPATLQITGSVTTNQDPGQLALTSGGEWLYATLNTNGTIARIDPATMTVSSTFAVGTDASYGTLYAADICTVAGQPNLLVVSQYRKSVTPSHNGVAVYDNGVRRTNKTQDHTGSNIIEPSSDPSIYFGYNTESTEYGFRRLKLDANGMSQLEVNTTLLSGFYLDMRSDGDRVYSGSGVALNGAQMRRLGVFNTSGLVRPDSASNRIYYLEPQPSSSTTFDKLSAYDPTTFSLIRRLSLPFTVTSPGGFIRWGANGLAFRAGTSIHLINSSQIVPSDPPANLVVTTQATPNPATVGQALTYTVQVTNQGPNPATSPLLTATLSDSQTIQSVTASTGTPTTSGLVVSLPVGTLASGASATLTIIVSPQSAGALTCSASASSNAVDPDATNNFASKLVSVGFVSGPDVVNQLRLAANNVVYDSTRQLLWVTIPATVAAPLGKSLISVNPASGLMSDPIPLNASPMGQSMALSPNGQYLYIGLSDVSEVHRIDLNASPMTSVRIPLGLSQWGSANYAKDIEGLDGDGTSFIIAGTDDHSAAAYDGTVRRTNRSGIYTVDRIERTPATNTFIGYNNHTSGFGTTRLTVAATGVSIAQTVSSLVSGYGVDIAGSGNLLLSSSGVLANSATLSLITNLGVSGRPCVDAANQRAYLVSGSSLRSFNADSGVSAGSLALPTTATGDWALSCVRWGGDGFAILGSDKLYVARWSAAVPAGADANTNGIADQWEMANFGAVGVDAAADSDGDGFPNGLEYLLVTSPTSPNTNPVETSVSREGSNAVIHLVFARRAGVSRSLYGYACSANLQAWNAALGVTETVLSTQTVEGTQVETVDAAVPSPSQTGGFVRLTWQNP